MSFGHFRVKGGHLPGPFLVVPSPLQFRSLCGFGHFDSIRRGALRLRLIAAPRPLPVPFVFGMSKGLVRGIPPATYVLALFPTENLLDRRGPGQPDQHGPVCISPECVIPTSMARDGVARRQVKGDDQAPVTFLTRVPLPLISARFRGRGYRTLARRLALCTCSGHDRFRGHALLFRRSG